MRIWLVWLLPLWLCASSQNIWEKVGKIYNIDPGLLYAIGKVESDIDKYVVAFNFTKMTQAQERKLHTFLAHNRIESKRYTQVISIKSKTRTQAVKVVQFLDQNNYPRFDMGIMQINSVHKPLLHRANITFADLFDPLVNIQVGAYILADCMKRYKDHKDAINAYNGKIDNNPYSQKVLSTYKKLYGTYGYRTPPKTKQPQKNPS